MREFVGAAWRLQGVVEASREAGGGRSREEVDGARGRARQARARVLLAREEDDRGGSGGGLGQREELGRAGKQVSGPGGRLPFYFCSVLFFLIIVFYLFQSVLI